MNKLFISATIISLIAFDILIVISINIIVPSTSTDLAINEFPTSNPDNNFTSSVYTSLPVKQSLSNTYIRFK